MELSSASCLSVAEDRETALMAMGALEIRLSEQRRSREVGQTQNSAQPRHISRSPTSFPSHFNLMWHLLGSCVYCHQAFLEGKDVLVPMCLLSWAMQ